MDYQKRARELLGNRSLVFSLSQAQIYQNDPELFRRYVETAAGCGATHVAVGQLPYLHGTAFLPDNHDPYASWCNTTMGLLWAFPPEELRAWIPAEESERRQNHLAEQVEELRRFRLKGAFGGIEPLWLPEDAYRAHPGWRGAQCELARIARRPYFAPSIDEPEVLALYRKAMRELSSRFPEIERFDFMSNDSGAGISWTPNTYPGMNGPLAWRKRDPGERIAGWLDTLQQGSADVGVKIAVHLHSTGLSPEIKSATKHNLKAGQYLNWVGSKSQPPWCAGNACLGGGLWNTSYPVAGLADPSAFVAELQQVYSNPEGDSHYVAIAADGTHLRRAATLIEAFLRDPGGTARTVQQARVLNVAARTICGGEQWADTLVEAWAQVHRATHAVQQVRQKGFGHVMPFCGVSMRWITRPLVPQPLKLTPEQSEYYSRFLLSVDTPETNSSFSFVLGKQIFRGESVMWMARWCLDEAYNTLRAARARLAEAANESEGAGTLRLEAARIEAFACLVKNAQNVIRYQYALDVAHYPQFGWNVMDYDENMLFDQRALQLRKIAREELDNTQRLIEIIQSQDEPVLVRAPHVEAESVFLLGPDLVGDLKRKMNIMLDRWQDYETLYPTTKVRELESRASEMPKEIIDK